MQSLPFFYFCFWYVCQNKSLLYSISLWKLNKWNNLTFVFHPTLCFFIYKRGLLCVCFWTKRTMYTCIIHRSGIKSSKSQQLWTPQHPGYSFPLNWKGSLKIQLILDLGQEMYKRGTLCNLCQKAREMGIMANRDHDIEILMTKQEKYTTRKKTRKLYFLNTETKILKNQTQ